MALYGTVDGRCRETRSAEDVFRSSEQLRPEFRASLTACRETKLITPRRIFETANKKAARFSQNILKTSETNWRQHLSLVQDE